MVVYSWGVVRGDQTAPGGGEEWCCMSQLCCVNVAQGLLSSSGAGHIEIWGVQSSR